MIDASKIFETKTEVGLVSISNESEKTSSLTLRSNAAYETVLGFNFIIRKTSKITVNNEAKYYPNETAYNGTAMISVVEASGRVLMPQTPFELLKHSKEVEFERRFISIEGVKGFDNDIKINFTFSPEPNSVGAEVVYYQVCATAVYSKRSKSTF
ncbi:hypothetical protein [Alistipes sp. ZOR0009]|uniref:hypothetical protein n=1 Tax=Alistipes sp. ZOR0009 TaxID=1339253 RepID=UPI000647BBAC|nr:hypothetical protein [Alistipes sp. ZOR0009]